MSKSGISRRNFLNGCVLTAGALAAGRLDSAAAAGGKKRKVHIATNVYPWMTFYEREGKDFMSSLDAGLEAIASTGIEGFEPIANNPSDIVNLAPLLKKHKLQMRSLYVNSTLHEKAQIDASIESILAIAAKARSVGTSIILTNPNPISWDGKTAKDDGQLRLQAEALNRLGRELKKLGLKLSYHNHDMEMRNSAREFHHMMLGTDAELVSLCLDAHWIYRGSGNSNVALFDIVQLYGNRISEIHIRQSKENIWTEEVCDGDINYEALLTEVFKMCRNPHLVLEQSVEAGAPKTMDAVNAHKKSLGYVLKVLGRVAG
jgi:inosose dehydratase